MVSAPLRQLQASGLGLQKIVQGKFLVTLSIDARLKLSMERTFSENSAVSAAEEHIANFFGLNESKYQWAVDEHMKQQLSGDATFRPRPTRTREDQPGMQPTDLQIMDRNSSKGSR